MAAVDELIELASEYRRDELRSKIEALTREIHSMYNGTEASS